jgi:hypothetical protein
VEASEAFTHDAMNAFMDRCTKYHVLTSNPRRFTLLKGLCDKISGTENCAVHVEVGAPFCLPGLVMQPLIVSDLFSVWRQLWRRMVCAQEYYPDGIVATSASGERRFWVSVLQTNVLPRIGLEKCLKLFGLRKIDVLRCHMDRVQDPGNGQVREGPHPPRVCWSCLIDPSTRCCAGVHVAHACAAA